MNRQTGTRTASSLADKQKIAGMTKEHILPALTKLVHDPASKSMPLAATRDCVYTIWTFNKEVPFNCFSFLMKNQKDQDRKKQMKQALTVCVHNIHALRIAKRTDSEFRREVERFSSEVAAISARSLRGKLW